MRIHKAWVLTLALTLAAGAETVVVHPVEYPRALRNPLKGFTNRGFREDNPWATLVHCYIPWNEIERRESDGIERIRQWCDSKWGTLAARNQKVIPRVYLHWSGDRRYWPEDMTPGDYESPQFVARVTRLVARLGECWDTDPRVAHVEMGLIGKWGEQHSPAPTVRMQRILGEAFTRAFPHKQVLVRHPWREFTAFSFGAYWDSWAHADQMATHGAGVKSLGDRWQRCLMGGEVAYDWGHHALQPGDDPTDTVTDPNHRDFLIDTIRDLHATQLRWVADYDLEDPAAQAGAELVQRAFGYRYVLHEVRYPRRVDPGQPFTVSLRVVNTGSAPCYADWPVELSLLDGRTGRLRWRATFDEARLSSWLPGDDWDPGRRAYRRPAPEVTVAGTFTLAGDLRPGTYRLALAVLDPAGELPALRFATLNYQRGGRHPMGWIGVGRSPARTTLDPARFDDPSTDDSLHYKP